MCVCHKCKITLIGYITYIIIIKKYAVTVTARIRECINDIIAHTTQLKLLQKSLGSSKDTCSYMCFLTVTATCIKGIMYM